MGAKFLKTLQQKGSSFKWGFLISASPSWTLSSPAPPNFLPISAAAAKSHSDKRASSQRRHSIEKEAPASVVSFGAPPSRQASKSLVGPRWRFFFQTLVSESVRKKNKKPQTNLQ